MANPTTGFFETHVLPAMVELTEPTQLANSMLKKIYVQSMPVPGRPGQTINVPIPTVNEGDVIDIGNGPIQVTDEDHTNVALTVNNNKSVARKISDFDQIRTPMDLREFYLQPMMESLARKIDRQVCNLCTSTNFNIHSSITGGADTFDRVDLTEAWRNLVGVGVPMSPGAIHFVTSHVPYSNMIADTAWINEAIVGIASAESAQQRAYLAPAVQAMVDYDPLMLIPSAGTYAGLYFHRAAIALVPVSPTTPAGPQVQQTLTTLPGTNVAVRLQYWYDPREQGWILHAHAVFALNVVRPNYGSYLVTT
jgi:hypothetical protein